MFNKGDTDYVVPDTGQIFGYNTNYNYLGIPKLFKLSINILSSNDIQLGKITGKSQS